MSSSTDPPAPPASHDLPTDLPANAGRAATGIAIVLVAQLMLVLDATVVNVALPRIDADLGFGPASLSWVLNAYTLAFGGLLLLGGRLGDVRGRLRIFEIGLGVFTALLAARRPGADPEPAGRRPRPAGRRRRDGRTQRAGPAHHQRPRRGRAEPGPGPLRRRLLRRRVHRPAARRRGHRHRLVALDAVHQRPDRPGRAARSPVASSTETPRRPGRFDVVGAVTATLGAVSLVWALIGTPEHGWTSARTLGGFAVGAAAARRARRHRAPGRAPDDPAGACCAAAAGSPRSR